MTRIKLKYIHAFTDRHGIRRHYFRRPGYERMALPGLPGSAEFMAAYQAALSGEQAPKKEIGSERTKSGSMNALIIAYYKSSEFTALEKSTQVVYRNILERLRTDHGDKPVASLKRKHIYELIHTSGMAPTSANKFLSILRILMRLALDLGLREDDPTVSVRSVQYKSDGFYTWTEEDIEQFIKYWPLGTTQRLAFDLLLYTAQRGSDVRVMGRQHIKNDKISISQKKTKNPVDVPIHSRLRQSLNLITHDHLTFVVTQHGAPFSPKGFGQWFSRAASKAGLPKVASAHGLRKAASRRLAEAGCTDRQIMAITGHMSVSEVERYTRAMNRVRMAEQGMRRLADPQEETE